MQRQSSGVDNHFEVVDLIAQLANSIQNRQGEANVELDEVEIVETFIATELERLNYDALIDQVRIPVAVIAD